MGQAYMGKILMVDLTTHQIVEETVPDQVYEDHLAGLGLGAYILYHRIPKGADPLGPDNMIGFLSGLLTGTGSLFTGRWMVVGKSPLTGGWGEANCGGNLSPAIKKCGYDGIFFSGKSKNPVYLEITDQGAKLCDAEFLWGKDAVETEEILIEKANNPQAKVACIGPSGEKLSLISGVCNDRGRIAARSGLGAVMGSKNLKALVLSGTQTIPTFDPKQIKKLSRKTMVWVHAQPPLGYGPISGYLGYLLQKSPVQPRMDGILYKILLKRWGTGSMNQMSVEIGDAPVKNWAGTSMDFTLEKSKKLNPDVFNDPEIKKYSCYSCPIGCGGICKITGKYKTYDETHKPEYETVNALGALCLNNDADSIFHMNEVLNRAGMDTISAGATVAFAIESYESGVLTKEQADGLELTWGNSQAMVALIEKMVKREGIGDLLADGVKVAAQKLGQNADKFAMHSGGQELPMHDGRNDPGFALHYSVEPSPGKHTSGSQLFYEMFQLWRKIKWAPEVPQVYDKSQKYVSDETTVLKAVACSKFMNMANGVGLCLFGAFLGMHRLPLFEWLNAATGWQKTPDEYLEVGGRIQTIKQAFNVKHGINPSKVKLNDRALGFPPLKDGANKGRMVYIQDLVTSYWKHFGWNEKTGKPTSATMKELGL